MLKKSNPLLIHLIVFVLAFDLAFCWQKQFGAYKSEFGGHPDEAAHVVTGLFIRDALVMASHYAMAGFHGSPIQIGRNFADEYYTHYPKIGLGVWPPFFYLVQSAWTLPLGASRTSLLLLLCALAAILTLILFRVLFEEFGLPIAGVSVAVLLSLPLVRDYYGMVMAETLSALLMFGAVVAFGNFLDRERRGDAIWFGVLTALAILTKGTGLALVLAAPLALLLTRRFHLLRRRALWLAVFIVAVVAGPWTVATSKLGQGGWLQPNPSWSFTREALPYYTVKLGHALGWALVILAVIGLVVKIGRPSSRKGLWAAAGSLIIAIVVFQSIAPVGLEARHLIPALPAAMLFAAAGFHFLAQRLSDWRPAVLAVAALVAIAPALLPLTTKGYSGFAALATSMLADAGPRDVTLVSSDATGEGIFISEVALQEPRPGHVIQRASKSLASSTWSGSGYTPAFARDDQLYTFLTSGQLRYLVLDDALPADHRREHHDQLKRVIESHPERFLFLADSDVRRAGVPERESLKLYKIATKN